MLWLRSHGNMYDGSGIGLRNTDFVRADSGLWHFILSIMKGPTVHFKHFASVRTANHQV